MSKKIGEEKNYTDVTKVYTLADETGLVDGYGRPMMWPRHEEFYRTFRQATSGYIWGAWKEKDESGVVISDIGTNNANLAGAASVSTETSKAATSAVKAMNKSIVKSAPESKKAGKKVGSAATEGIKTYMNYTNGKKIGKNMTDGMASGLKSGKDQRISC